MNELSKLKQEIKRLQKLITEIENTEQKPKIYSNFPKERVREQIISKLTTDESFEKYLDNLPDYLVGNLKLKLTYTEQREPDEIIISPTGITRTIKSNLERADYKGRKKHIHLVRDIQSGGIYDDD